MPIVVLEARGVGLVLITGLCHLIPIMVKLLLGLRVQVVEVVKDHQIKPV